MLRSLLYVPANSDKFIAKAHERGADAIILDLEDSVPSNEKIKARNHLRDAVASVARNGAIVFVRINGADTPFFEGDIVEVARQNIFGLLVPKVTGPAIISTVETHLLAVENQNRSLRIVPIIEDPGAVLDARAIAKASQRNFAMITGGEDLATAMGAQPTPEFLHLPKLLVHLAAKAEGLCSLGLLHNISDFKDTTAYTKAVLEAKTFGFDGASCVHPALIPLLNQGFSPTMQDIETARRLVEFYEQNVVDGKGAILFEGQMVDRPVVERARRILHSAS